MERLGLLEDDGIPFILPLEISMNPAIIEQICLNLEELTVDSISTLNFLLMRYPAIKKLQTIKDMRRRINTKLGNIGQIHDFILISHVDDFKKYSMMMTIPKVEHRKFRIGELFYVSFEKFYTLPDYKLINLCIHAIVAVSHEISYYILTFPFTTQDSVDIIQSASVVFKDLNGKISNTQIYNIKNIHKNNVKDTMKHLWEMQKEFMNKLIVENMKETHRVVDVRYFCYRLKYYNNMLFFK